MCQENCWSHHVGAMSSRVVSTMPMRPSTWKEAEAALIAAMHLVQSGKGEQEQRHLLLGDHQSLAYRVAG